MFWHDFAAALVRRGPARFLAWAIGCVLGGSSTAAIGLALLLAGRGEWLLGAGAGSRWLCAALLVLGAASSIVLAKVLQPLLGADASDPVTLEAERLPRWLAWTIGGALLLFVAAAIAQTRQAPDGAWDAWAIWNARARSLFRSGGDVRLACAAARDLAGFTAHPEYPLLLPAALALAWRLSGGEHAAVPALLSLCSALLLVAIAAFSVARTSAARAGWVAALLLTTPALSAMAAAQYAELPLDALVLSGVALLLFAWQRDDWQTNDVTEDRLRPKDSHPDDLHPNGFGPAAVPFDRTRARLLFLAGFALALSASVKHEGLLFLFAASWMTLLSRPRDLLPMALGAALPLALCAWFTVGFAPPGDLAQGGAAAALQRGLSLPRAGQIALGLARRLVYFQAWALHLLAFAGALAFRLYRNDLSRPARRLIGICALAWLGFCAAWLTTPHELDWHLRTSIDRLLLQLWPAALVALALPKRSRGQPIDPESPGSMGVQTSMDAKRSAAVQQP